ncbi:hypothetical protein BH695_4142 [Microcystis aeruginosa PCC 7806SL]|uniref:Uncharacterized protein n=1 Tax=Microcystis aeruginosa PCC 7806SL TaxID=1903187 RepID=A0AB33C5K2_MICA7|nr:hypothetical protein BH695_4142 [Microcystis aeruginosa PCC 7806SL]
MEQEICQELAEQGEFQSLIGFKINWNGTRRERRETGTRFNP